MLGAESAGQMRGMHPDRMGQLSEPDVIADAGAQQLLRRAQPWLRPTGVTFDSRLPARCGQQLQGKTFGGERRCRVRGAELSGKTPGEPAEAVPAKLDEPVETMGGRSQCIPWLNDRDPSALSAEAGSVPRAGRHRHPGGPVEPHRSAAKRLLEAPVENEREIRQFRVEGDLNIARREPKL